VVLAVPQHPEFAHILHHLYDVHTLPAEILHLIDLIKTPELNTLVGDALHQGHTNVVRAHAFAGLQG